jgi:hypothetical protein
MTTIAPNATYVARAVQAVREETGVGDPDLLRFYALLVLTLGDRITPGDVHDAWALWKLPQRPDHRSLVPFDELDAEEQMKDQPYVDGLRRAAQRLAE